MSVSDLLEAKHQCQPVFSRTQRLLSVLQAQAVALTVAQAFTIAFELWQVAKEGE